MHRPMTDSRRFVGPPDSKDYHIYMDAEESEKTGESRSEKERDSSKLRSLFCEVGVITRAKGSAYVERGKTKVLASVFGPREIPKKSDFSSMKGILSVDYREAPFASRKSRNLKEEKDASLFLSKTLESTVCLHLYPKSQIDVYVLVLENDGSALASAITAAGLALSDASINLFDLVIGASLRVIEDQVYIDPCLEVEERFSSPKDKSDGSIVIGYQPSLEQIAALFESGAMDKSVISSQIRSLTKTANETLPHVQRCIIDSVKDKVKQISTT